MTVEAWPDDDGGIVPASVAAAIVAEAWTAKIPGSDVVALAVGDGGPRTADAVDGPMRIVGQALAVESPAGTILAPLDGLRWNPHRLASALFGLAREVPAGTDPPTIIVPLGDVPPAGDAIDVWGPNLEAARDALSRLSMIALVGSDRPLLGFHGMSAATMVGRESDRALAAAAQVQERRWAEIATEGDAGGMTSALAGTPRTSDVPGSGAAGGLAYCLAAAGAHLAPGAVFAASLAGLDDLSPPPDLIVAVCRDLTPRGIDHGSIVPASAAAARLGVPCVAIGPEVQVGKRDLMAAGIAGAYPAESGVNALVDRVGRVAHTWTPRS